MRARKDQAELHLGAAVGDGRVRVDHVDDVVAHRKHVTPGAQVSRFPRQGSGESQLRGAPATGSCGLTDRPTVRFSAVSATHLAQRRAGASAPATNTVFVSSCGVAPSG